MGVYDKLAAVQKELKAPKGQYNSFGGYHYRSCEDIIEGVKPILAAHRAAIILSDEVVQVGDRFYIRAQARFVDCEGNDSVDTYAFAREDAQKKGMDGAQVTGSASSYARKYALNGLLAIDDTKDSDCPPPAPEPKQQDDLHFKCQRCGKVLKPTTDKNGKYWSVRELSEKSNKSFGRCLCADCMGAENANRGR